jgi:TP901 family phage tail tape measure protein
VSGSPLASLFVALGLDASAFDKGIDEAGAKTDSLGKKGISAGQVFSGGMVAIGAGLGVVTGAAMQAERAQGDFMAATGASRDEAKQFVSGMDSLAGSAGAVGKSFSDIAGAGSLIAQQMGTTGDETTKLTGQILTFAKVTKTDVSTAITGLDDAMDSWNLTADQTGNVMDVVTAGVQEFGGTAQDSLGLLNTLAPSLQAANMQWDDAAGLINLFNRAGVDASVTATAFNKVLTKVKSPEELQRCDKGPVRPRSKGCSRVRHKGWPQARAGPG